MTMAQRVQCHISLKATFRAVWLVWMGEAAAFLHGLSSPGLIFSWYHYDYDKSYNIFVEVSVTRSGVCICRHDVPILMLYMVGSHNESTNH